MSTVELTKMSSKGQVVIPQLVRNELKLKDGETFAVMGRADTIVLKKIIIPSPKETFEKVHKWGLDFAKSKGITEDDLRSMLKRTRRK